MWKDDVERNLQQGRAFHRNQQPVCVWGRRGGRIAAHERFYETGRVKNQKCEIAKSSSFSFWKKRWRDKPRRVRKASSWPHRHVTMLQM